ncbi:Fur family transcriptional regulator [Reichenbachiella ulvae]|uniref:Transcriptional repressor n=1 Tax=Reichenbachiella ulvae TaxID=2980104 RepID=A0ABT3CRH0_9BACT|nr:transcriptional repressor [Reichenbachiella ulvae]MCV9385873.1 transcriptional repressor [Reichenbachiella ulvae]
MQFSELKNFLKQHKLRVTDCRLDVLQLFKSKKHALTSRVLEDELTGYDRVTLFRTLNTFIEAGIVHKIPDDSGVARYGVCDSKCDAEAHHHDHVHFKCDECGNVDCLPTHHVPRIEIPGYIIKDSNMILNGLCRACNG